MIWCSRGKARVQVCNTLTWFYIKYVHMWAHLDRNTDNSNTVNTDWGEDGQKGFFSRWLRVVCIYMLFEAEGVVQYDAQVFGCFNQLYCLTVTTCKHWLGYLNSNMLQLEMRITKWSGTIGHLCVYTERVGLHRNIMSGVRRGKHVCLTSVSLPFLIRGRLHAHVLKASVSQNSIQVVQLQSLSAGT